MFFLDQDEHIRSYRNRRDHDKMLIHKEFLTHTQKVTVCNDVRTTKYQKNQYEKESRSFFTKKI